MPATRIYPHPNIVIPQEVHVPGRPPDPPLQTTVTSRGAFDAPQEHEAQLWPQAGSVLDRDAVRQPAFAHGPIGGVGLDMDPGWKYAAEVLSEEPALYWPLDDAAGPAIADLSGNGRGGTVVGGVTLGSVAAPAGGGYAADFDGVNGRITTTYKPFVNGTSRTFLGWAYRDTSTSIDTLMGSTGGAGQSTSIRLDSGGNNFSFDVDTTDGIAAVTWAGAWPGNGQWVFWAVVFDEPANTASLYINGALVNAQATTGQWDAAIGGVALGVVDSTLADPLDGKQAHFAVLEHAVSAARIAAIYAAA